MILLLQGCSWILNRLPIDTMAGFLGWFFFSVVGFRKKTVLENLKLALGDQYSNPELMEIAQKNYKHYALTLFETWQSLTWDRKKILEKVKISGIEVLKENPGSFLLSLHLGSWEIALAATAALGMPVDAVVKRAKNPIAQRFLEWYRARMGTRILLESGTANDILVSLKEGHYVVFILDQFMGPPIGLPIQFFGHEAGTAAGLALLTEKKEVKVIAAYSYRKDGILHVEYGPILEAPHLSAQWKVRLYEKSQTYNNWMESVIRKYPEQWLWLHRRWKAYQGEPRWKLATQS